MSGIIEYQVIDSLSQSHEFRYQILRKVSFIRKHAALVLLKLL